MLGFERRYLTHDCNRAALANHEVHVIAQVSQNLIQTIVAACDCKLHGFTTHFGCTNVAEVDEFFLTTHIVIQRRVSQAEPVGDVLERRAAVTFLIETVGRRPEHAVALQLKARLFSDAR